MGLSVCLSMLLCLFLKLAILSEIVVSDSFTSLQPSCHEDERSALLLFKESFFIDKSSCVYSKLSEWKSEGVNASNCCSWDGIQCDEETGYVIGLDVSSSCLFGSINSSNGLFNLVHLRSLDLSDNDFSYSQIPTAINQFSGLEYLNLSFSGFIGQVPMEISQLSKLVVLDLSLNYVDDKEFLLPRIYNFTSFLQNLTSLEILDLRYVDLSSTIPNFLSNFSSLTSLRLDVLLSPYRILCHFLRILDVRFNENLTGQLPEFHQRSPLRILRLQSTKFSGSLPSSIEKLDMLVMLSAYDSKFSGPIPSSLGKLTKLTFLDLGKNNFGGYIPSSFQNLTQLTALHLPFTQIIGQIPPWLGNLTKLEHLDLSNNQLHGPIPESLSKLINLGTLNLHLNNLGGIVRFDMFFNMKKLTELQLNSNNLSMFFDKTNASAAAPQFKLLGLASCNLNEFPDFLKHQNELEWLTLVGNNIQGQVPEWMCNTSLDTLVTLYLNNNFLTGFPQNLKFLPWVNLRNLFLSYNMLKGALPIPLPSIMIYDVSNNMLSGEVSPLFCNMSSLDSLDLSNNNLGGMIPKCMGNISISLSALSLRNNSFHGIIPQLSCNNESNLRMIDFSDNQLQGQLPRSLSKCMMLESIVLSNNQLNDTFPSWLGSLPELKVLSLHNNEFHGEIGKPHKELEFSKLQVIDLSYNNFIGELPSQYIFNWNAMKGINPSDSAYLNAEWNFSLLNNYMVGNNEAYKITISTKGVLIYYGVIPEMFAFIDLSSNRFEGEIPDLFGSLKALRSLNLSNNMLTGRIPSSLGNITLLESLDLSQNNLIGEIPQKLKQLGFLARFNVSHNNLTGSIPQGNQFNTFDSSSFEGNPALCGDQLLKKCRNSQFSPPAPSTSEEDYNAESLLKLDWKFVLAGYITGLVVGMVLDNIVFMSRPRWFLKMLPKRISNNLERRQRN
ncbi:receptor-like protein 7 [Ziziphus jujuba]|uniref:Receptor-like protein 7 n=1 Tax=Ziziphus jujuba TaxID=326968 RepID=A0ABM4A543_ZIZJJ|nr:receptor-like protein 7 [Ziziphus jujuba]